MQKSSPAERYGASYSTMQRVQLSMVCLRTLTTGIEAQSIHKHMRHAPGIKCTDPVLTSMDAMVLHPTNCRNNSLCRSSALANFAGAPLPANGPACTSSLPQRPASLHRMRRPLSNLRATRQWRKHGWRAYHTDRCQDLAVSGAVHCPRSFRTLLRRPRCCNGVSLVKTRTFG